MKKILVTGGNGFIGKKLVSELIKHGHQIIVLDNNLTMPFIETNNQIQWVKDDLTNRSILKDIIANIDGCFHLAAISSVERCTANYPESSTVNMIGFINLLDCIKKLNTKPFVIFTSTSAVYGNHPSLPLTETSPTYPISNYGADKLCCEIHAQTISRNHSLPIAIARLFNVYGPGQNPASPYSGVITKFIRNLISQIPLTIFGDGQQTRDFIYLDDVIQYLIRLIPLANPSCPIYNVASGNPISVSELLKTILKVTEHLSKIKNSPEIEFALNNPNEIKFIYGDPSKIRKATKYLPQVSFDEGIVRTMHYQLSSADTYAH